MRGRSAPSSSRRRRSRCTHHWVIEMASGATSNGQCKRCGSVKRFRNSAQPGKLTFYLRRSKSS